MKCRKCTGWMLALLTVSGFTAPAPEASAETGRTYVVSGSGHITDHENWPIPNQFWNGQLATQSGALYQSNTPTLIYKDYKCAGNEVRGEVDVQGLLLPDGAIKFIFYGRLYEGDSCANQNMVAATAREAVVAPGQSDTVVLYATNGSDVMHFNVTVENVK